MDSAILKKFLLFTWLLNSRGLAYVGRIGTPRLRGVWIDYTSLEPIRDRSVE